MLLLGSRIMDTFTEILLDYETCFSKKIALIGNLILTGII